MIDLAVMEAETSEARPSGWSERRLQDVAQLINGRGFKPFEWDTTGLPIIRIQNLNGSDDFNYYSGRYDPKIEIDPGQLLFAWSGSRGTSFGPHIWNGPKGVLNYHTWKVRVNESEIVPGFFFHVLRHLTRIIEDQAHGASALVHVQKWEMEKFPFQCPDAPKEQTAIAEALSDADALIEGLERLIAKKRLIKQGAMQDLLTARRRLPGFSREWVMAPLRQLCSQIQDGTHFTPTYVEYGTPFYSVENVTARNFESCRYVTSEAHEAMAKRCRPTRGDILMTRIGSIGDTYLVDWDHEASIYVSLCLLRPGKSIDAGYLYSYSRSSMFVKEVEDRSLPNAIPKKINLGDIADVRISMPTDPAEQSEIAAILLDMDTEIQTLETRLEKARAVKEGMMQNLLTGRIRLV